MTTDHHDPATTADGCDCHRPCCSSHAPNGAIAVMDCARYRRTHFVQVGPCCPHWTAPANTTTDGSDRDFEALARTITHDRLAHYGYTPDRIAFAEQPRQHGERCTRTEHGWDCIDENGDPAHPEHDEADQTAEFIIWVLEHEALGLGERRAAPATVDPADLRATIAEVCYRAWHAGRSWDDQEPDVRAEYLNAADAVLAALTAAGWPANYQPDPHLAKPSPASADFADVQRLAVELRANARHPERLDGIAIRAAAGWLVDLARERDAAQAAVTAAGWPHTYQPNPDVTAAREARAEVERLKVQLSNYAHDRDEAQADVRQLLAQRDVALNDMRAREDDLCGCSEGLCAGFDGCRDEAASYAGAPPGRTCCGVPGCMGGCNIWAPTEARP